MDKAYEICEEFLEIFDREHFYLEIQDHGIEEQKKVNEGLYQLAKELNLELVATNDAHYLTRADARTQDILMAIQMGKTVDDPTRMKFETQEFYIKDADEMAALFPEHPEALANTVKIAERCQVDFEFGKYHLPEFDVPEGYTSLEYLQKLCDEGFVRRYPDDDGTVRKRLQYEIDMIAKMGFVDYFLIVSDFIGYAKSQGIPVGPGRGSAAGSIVSYCLGITDLDPIHYSLYFERFLNPERVSMPDIDVDFCYVRRPEVIEYVTRKYGKDRVAQIVTFGTMAARGAIRDVGRALNIPYNDVDAVAKQVPNELHMTIEKALSVNPELKKMYDGTPQVRELIDTARKLEGMPRNASTHAAGVVITKNPVDTYVPLSRNGDQMVTQFTMVTIEELGLLKMDFLGLRNLTVIADAEKMIRRHTPEFSIETVDMQRPGNLRNARKRLDHGRVPARERGHYECRHRPAATVHRGHHRSRGAVPPGTDAVHPALHRMPPSPRKGDVQASAARAHPRRYLRLHDLSGTGHAGVPVARRLLARQGGHGAPRDE